MDLYDRLEVEEEYITDLLENPTHPVVLAFLDIHKQLVSTPVWTLYDGGCFLFFSSKKSMKVRTIEQGNTEFSVLLIRRESYPVVIREELPYLSMTGSMEIITETEQRNVNDLHIALLEKYDSPDQETWVRKTIDRLKTDPEGTWMLRFTPEKIRTY